MKKIRCYFDEEDFLQITYDESFANISIQSDGLKSDIALSPDKIRKLRKQLKRALVEIEGDLGEGKDGEECCGPKKQEWVPVSGDKVRFVNPGTLDHKDKYTWFPKEGETYVVRHVYEGGWYEGFSLLETPENKHTCLGHGYKFRKSGFEPA